MVEEMRVEAKENWGNISSSLALTMETPDTSVKSQYWDHGRHIRLDWPDSFDNP